jgi:hypothetical protein
MAIMKKRSAFVCLSFIHLISFIHRDYSLDNNRYYAIIAQFEANHVSSFEREGRMNTGQHLGMLK